MGLQNVFIGLVILLFVAPLSITVGIWLQAKLYARSVKSKGKAPVYISPYNMYFIYILYFILVVIGDIYLVSIFTSYFIKSAVIFLLIFIIPLLSLLFYSINAAEGGMMSFMIGMLNFIPNLFLSFGFLCLGIIKYLRGENEAPRNILQGGRRLAYKLL
jgi:hypothetical protein